VTAFLWVALILGLVDILGRFLLLAKNEYPRPVSRGTELFTLFANFAMGAWAAHLLLTTGATP